MLDQAAATITTERSSKKQPLTDDDARALLASVDTVRIARGKKLEELPASEATLDHLRGPTGGYRAPILRQGRTLLVGFHPEALGEMV
ncbi:MAG TPA: hypothetical protein VF017_16610 [Thermoanaerobaculia bacterium]|nr:hypothetical protein [Thermoanaerobaculia bacterium]